MVAGLLDGGGIDPTVINGGIIQNYGSNARLGTGDWMVVEADESDGTFVKLPATIMEYEKWKKGRRYGKFSNFRYWRDVARPLLESARGRGGFWTEVLDPGLAVGDWDHATFRKVADPLVVSHLAADEVGGG